MGYLQVIDLCGDGGLPGNGDEFFQGRKYLFALVAQVGGVNAAVLRSRAGEGNEFIGFREARRGVDQ